jgi:hypothetical protein
MPVGAHLYRRSERWYELPLLAHRMRSDLQRPRHRKIWPTVRSMGAGSRCGTFRRSCAWYLLKLWRFGFWLREIKSQNEQAIVPVEAYGKALTLCRTRLRKR